MNDAAGQTEGQVGKVVVNNREDYDRYIEEAREAGHFVVVKLYKPGCESCRYLENQTDYKNARNELSQGGAIEGSNNKVTFIDVPLNSPPGVRAEPGTDFGTDLQEELGFANTVPAIAVLKGYNVIGRMQNKEAKLSDGKTCVSWTEWLKGVMEGQYSYEDANNLNIEYDAWTELWRLVAKLTPLSPGFISRHFSCDVMGHEAGEQIGRMSAGAFILAGTSATLGILVPMVTGSGAWIGLAVASSTFALGILGAAIGVAAANHIYQRGQARSDFETVTNKEDQEDFSSSIYNRQRPPWWPPGQKFYPDVQSQSGHWMIGAKIGFMGTALAGGTLVGSLLASNFAALLPFAASGLGVIAFGALAGAIITMGILAFASKAGAWGANTAMRHNIEKGSGCTLPHAMREIEERRLEAA